MSDIPYALQPREPDWETLGREPEVDPVTFEVVRHKIEGINEEQAIALKAVSASPIVTEASDFNNGLYTATGDIVSMGPQVVFHAGCMTQVIRHVIADCADDPGIEDGDVFVVNDPHKGAVHHPDMSVVAPIFHDGELVAWSGATAHLVDVGGMTVGSISVKAIEKYQEGLMLPPVKLIERGRVRGDIWNLIMNASRQPEMVGLDLKGLIAANVVGRRRFAKLVEAYGIDTVQAIMREMIRFSERRLRDRLRELPDGEFEAQSFLDHDGHHNTVYRTHIKLTKRGSALEFDFSGSSAQAPGFINCTDSALVGGVFGGLAPLLAFDIPWNQGILNCLSVIAPVGLVCNAAAPAPTGSGTIGEGWVVTNGTVAAVSKLVACHSEYGRRAQGVTHGTFGALMLGERNQHGEPFGTQLMDAQLGGGGATAVEDGIDQAGGFVTPVPNIPNVETNELHGPMLYVFRGFIPDSGGPGEHRGGRAAGVAFTPYGVDALRCSFSTQGVEAPVSTGAFGGAPGQCSRQGVAPGAGVAALVTGGRIELAPGVDGFPVPDRVLGAGMTDLAAKTDEFPLAAGDLWQYVFQGGGGVGDPLRRAPGRVAADVAVHAVTPVRARDIYGVVLDDDGSVDEPATVGERHRLRGQRLADAQPPARAVREGAPGTDGIVLGPALRLARGEAGLQYECACGQVLCGGADNWKLSAARRVHEPGTLPPGVRLHETLQLSEYLCPACGTLHAVEVELRDQEPLQDFRLGVLAAAGAGA